MANSREEIKETQILKSVKHYYNITITRISLQIKNISKRQLKAEEKSNLKRESKKSKRNRVELT